MSKLKSQLVFVSFREVAWVAGWVYLHRREEEVDDIWFLDPSSIAASHVRCTVQ